MLQCGYNRVLWRISICVLVVHEYIYRNMYFTIMAPVEYKICLLYAEKSANLSMLKCANYFRRINQSYSNCRLCIAQCACHLRVLTVPSLTSGTLASPRWKLSVSTVNAASWEGSCSVSSQVPVFECESFITTGSGILEIRNSDPAPR